MHVEFTLVRMVRVIGRNGNTDVAILMEVNKLSIPCETIIVGIFVTCTFDLIALRIDTHRR